MMQQSEQEPEVSKTIKKRATLDSIPEDVALAIVEKVKGWVEESKTFQEKEKAKRTRDCALRAIALSCRKNFHFYFPVLLENVRINIGDVTSIQGLFSLRQGLFQRENHGHLVKSLHIEGLPADFSETAASLLWKDLAAISGLPSSVDYNIRCQQGFGMLLMGIFRSVPAIETLIIGSSIYIDGLFFERHAFFTNSLKKLYIGARKDDRNNLSARNGIWLLLFVPSLQEAALSMEFSIINDLQFLVEFGDTVEGLSRVSKLALNINFIWEPSKSKTWWGLERQSHRYSALGNQKTFAVSQLLRCVNTSQIVSLEIVANFEDQRDGDDTLLLVECLTGLHRSFNSLLHLRLFGLSFREDRPDSKWVSNFKNMKMLTLEGDILEGLQMCDHVPSSLEVIWFPSYTDEKFEEEDLLVQFIKRNSPSLPRLREVVVPKSPELMAEDVFGNLHNWTSYRERLEKEEIFTSGRVILRKAEEDEMIGDPSKPGEVFLSTFRWISS